MKYLALLLTILFGINCNIPVEGVDLKINVIDLEGSLLLSVTHYVDSTSSRDRDESEKTFEETVTKNGEFIFKKQIPSGNHYKISIKKQPNKPYQDCMIMNSFGDIQDIDKDEIEVSCTTFTPKFTEDAAVTADYMENDTSKIVLNWNAAKYSIEYNIYRCTENSNYNCTFYLADKIATVQGTTYTDENPSISEDYPEIQYYVEAVNGELTKSISEPTIIVAGIIRISVGSPMTIDLAYADYLTGSNGTVFQFSISSTGTYYFYVNGHNNDADLNIFTSQDSANSCSTYNCSGMPGFLTEGIETTQLEQISLTVNSGTASFPRIIYMRIFNYSSNDSVLLFGVRSSPYTDYSDSANFTNTDYIYTNDSN